MPRLLHTLLMLIWTRHNLQATSAAQKEIAGLNNREYTALCSIYTTSWSFLTDEDPTKKFDSSNEAGKQAQQRIDAFLVLANDTDTGYKAVPDASWKEAHPRPTNTELLSYLNKSLEALRLRAGNIAEEVKQATRQRHNKLTEARSAIFKALFRTDPDAEKKKKILAETADSADLAIAFASAGTYATMCTDGKEVGKSLIQDIVCICSEDSEKPQDKSCTAAGTATRGHPLHNGGQGAAQRWLALKAGCKKKGKELQPTTASNGEALSNGISRVHQLLGTNAYNLGKATDGTYPQSVMTILGGTNGGAATPATCDGASVDPTATTGAHGICVDYKGHASEDNLIPWAAELHTAAAAILGMEKAERKLAVLVAKLTSLAENMETTYLHASVRHPTTATNTAAETDQIDKKEKQCNAAGENKTECDKLKDKGCVFNDNGKKCELKKDVKQALEKENQETAGKEAATNTNTTTSNSFLIKKAPLWLAVLLL
uniref:Variant surface glycoprotein 567 n=1 Tax=Trypanosoma brucei TaxID=5691 RepID=M4TDI8_9TRYP|nr:variant surface glycoprotein 567 [Trypanosoma brucei]